MVSPPAIFQTPRSQELQQLASLRVLHYDRMLYGGIDEEGEAFCAECMVPVMCHTMRADSIEVVRALHYSAEFTRKVKDGWFKSHPEIVVLCHEDHHDWPCNTMRILGGET